MTQETRTELGPQHIAAAWINFRGSFDFASGNRLRLPIVRKFEPSSIDDVMNERASMPVAVFHMEHGKFDGQPASRIIGIIEGTDVQAIVEGPNSVREPT